MRKPTKKKKTQIRHFVLKRSFKAHFRGLQKQETSPLMVSPGNLKFRSHLSYESTRKNSLKKPCPEPWRKSFELQVDILEPF